ncbi:dTDP-4-dehydrorhamnose 3,5-epimerase [Altericroceibacterium xinjiangense]|uniref:dTDP-4-dehydrorhamnose 3,5-epimerase n=1 Tax=Altericroceibacterium xinjiangense TaxID=762261 RepID=UPI000F7E3A3A|nr:dTDP-4-dehydrorhamnose 3,5-epimerase [Altericroceibacterium xinjiangense]
MPTALISTRRHDDDRGWFRETWVERRWREYGVECAFVQDNHSYSADAGTIRGIHFQKPPHAQAKLVRCVRGRIIDYAVDLRIGSPTYGKYEAWELSAANGDQLFIPQGYGHAFITIEPDTEVAYKVSDYYAPDCESGLAWNCPDIGIEWPLGGRAPVLSAKDALLPDLRDFHSPFYCEDAPQDMIPA